MPILPPADARVLQWSGSTCVVYGSTVRERFLYINTITVADIPGVQGVQWTPGNEEKN